MSGSVIQQVAEYHYKEGLFFFWRKLYSGLLLKTKNSIRPMKKHKNEAQLLKLALQVGTQFAIKRGYKDFRKGISPKDKVECIYRLLVKDKLLTPLPEDKENGSGMKHRLIVWIVKQFPDGHELLQ